MILAPSLLSADFAALGHAAQLIEDSEAGWHHLDVMDGVFVPNISFGLPVIKALRPLCKKVFDVHLMIVNPDNYLEKFQEVGTDNLTVHIEACTHLHRTLHRIRELGMKAGVAINPHTPVSALEEVIEDMDLVVVMGVNPGFGGQKFIARSLDKIKALSELKHNRNPNLLIEIDGGVTLENRDMIVAAGTDVLVAGNSVFGAKDPRAAIAQFMMQ